MPWKDLSVVSVREEFVLRALDPNATLAALCREYGISRKTGYKWIERYESAGALGLRDLSRRPRTSPLEVSPEVVVDLIALRNGHPRWGARKLIWALQRAGAKSIPSERTVNRILERCGLIVKRRLRPKVAMPGAKPDTTADKSNSLWTADYKGWWRTGDFKRCEPLTVRDQFSRAVLAVHVCQSPQLDESMRLFERLFELYGVPEKILTDNGNPFVAVQSRFGLTRLSAWWLSLGIEHLRTRKGTPADNGAHERLHRDIALEVEAVAATTPEEQQRLCDLWRVDFNNNRPHEALGMKTPAQVYKPNPTSYTGSRVDLVYPQRMLVRTVSGSGCIKHDTRTILLTAALAGYTVGIDPQTGPPHEVWFSHRRLGWINLNAERPTVDAALPSLVCPEELNKGDTILLTNPSLETA
jgi:putative transposase